MADNSQGSVSIWFEALAAGEDEALTQIWQRFFNDLLAVARRHLADTPNRAFDEEDVVLSVFDALRKGAEQGRFDEMRDRVDMWKLLATMTRHKTIDRIRHETAEKRGGGAVRGDSALAGPADLRGFNHWMASEPTPDDLLAMQEETERLFECLRDGSLRRVAVLKLDGFTNDEIAEQLQVTTRTVERKLNLIRGTWVRELEKLT